MLCQKGSDCLELTCSMILLGFFFIFSLFCTEVQSVIELQSVECPYIWCRVD